MLLSEEHFGVLDKVMRSYAYHDSDHVPHAMCGGIERLYNANRELNATQKDLKLRRAEHDATWRDVPMALSDDVMVCLREVLRQLNPHYRAVLHAEYRFRGFFKKALTPAQLMRRHGLRYDVDLWRVNLNRAMAVVWSMLLRAAGVRFEGWFMV